jgi:hypothetical protein
MAADFVQGTGSATLGSVTITTRTFASPVTIDNTMEVLIGWRDGDAASMTPTVTDSAGHTWVPNTIHESGGTSAMKSYTARNLVKAAHVITVTMSAAVDDILGVYIVEGSGIHLTTALEDENAGFLSSGSSLNAGDVVSAGNALLLTMVLTSASRTISGVPTGYTAIGTSTRVRVAYRVVAAADTYSAVWSWTGGNAGARAFHDALQPPAAIIVATHVPYNLLNTRTYNHGYSR